MTAFLDEKQLKNWRESGIQLLLSGDPEGPVPAERSPWRRLAVCYSNIAFAVVLRSDTGLLQDDECEQARLALYRYLKRIQLMLFETGLVYPLACITIAEEGTVAHAEMTRWASDQDWHRGDFTFHVESTEDRARQCLRDLASLQVDRLMDERREPRTIRDHIRELGELLPERGRTRELGHVILDLWRAHEHQPFGDTEATQARMKIDDWLNEQIAGARRVAEGGGS